MLCSAHDNGFVIQLLVVFVFWDLSALNSSTHVKPFTINLINAAAGSVFNPRAHLAMLGETLTVSLNYGSTLLRGVDVLGAKVNNKRVGQGHFLCLFPL